MGNAMICKDCCDQVDDFNKDYQPPSVPVVNHKKSIKAPYLNKKLKNTLDQQNPFQKELSLKPTLKEIGNDIYEGEIDENQRPNGYGKMYHKDGSLFVGKFTEGVANGPGFYVTSHGSFYKGQIVQNKAQDENGYFWSQEYNYTGGIMNNEPHGKGVEESPNHKYDGEFVNGKRTKGVLQWKQNQFEMEYNGQFNDEGKFNGEGELKQKNGIYKGQFENGKKHGQGKFFFTNGALYEGQYVNNKKEGLGKLTRSNGDIGYEGEWGENLPHGKGKVGDKEGFFNMGIDSNRIS